ncbi:SGNH/GDSL hydrolase family protein [Desulfococcaceae bacterium HSG9]|nr:SGNH/GDSL hydrolase family protein [Desulfococcaceae bacterium HSG9]
MKAVKNIRKISCILAALIVIGWGSNCFGEIPIYRLYNNVAKVHLYSADSNEKAVLAATPDWSYECVAWQGYESDTGQYPVYRLYSPTLGKHLFTIDENEKNVLDSGSNWRYEMIAFYANVNPVAGDIPIYRLYNDSIKQHLFTADENEKNTLADAGTWKYEGIAYYTMPASCQSIDFRNIVAFGDSLSDHHGLESYLGLFNPVTNPNGVLPSWTNGDVWLDYLAETRNAVLDNNAIAGAMTAGHESGDIQALSDSGQLPPLGLVGQINLYIAQSPSFNSTDTLFTIMIGGNDLLEYGRGESSATTPAELITNAIDNILNSIGALAAEGALNFLVINLPDIGKTPAYNTMPAETILAASTLASSFNTALAYGLNEFHKAYPAINLSTFDLFSFLNEMIANGTFTDSTGTYLVLDAQGSPTGATNEPAEDHLFWDSIHPTTRVHAILADEVNNEVLDSACMQ